VRRLHRPLGDGGDLVRRRALVIVAEGRGDRQAYPIEVGRERAIERAMSVPVGESTLPMTSIEAAAWPRTAALNPAGSTNAASMSPVPTNRSASATVPTTRTVTKPCLETAPSTSVTKTCATSPRSRSTTA
jgi:hypothetical protein